MKEEVVLLCQESYTVENPKEFKPFSKEFEESFITIKKEMGILSSLIQEKLTTRKDLFKKHEKKCVGLGLDILYIIARLRELAWDTFMLEQEV